MPLALRHWLRGRGAADPSLVEPKLSSFPILGASEHSRRELSQRRLVRLYSDLANRSCHTQHGPLDLSSKDKVPLTQGPLNRDPLAR